MARRPGVKQQEEAEPVPEQTEECMLTEIRSDVSGRSSWRERGSRQTESGKAAGQSETRRVQASPAQVPRQKHQLSKEAQKNRQKVTAMNWGFVNVSGSCMCGEYYSAL